MPATFAVGSLLTRFFLCSSSGVIYAALLISPVAAQEPAQIPVEGYITAVQSPDKFVLDDQQVILQPSTTFAWTEDKPAHGDRNIREALQVGTFVQVYGSFHKRTESRTADSIRVRDDWARRVSGFSVIDKILSTGPEPFFRADGYLIRLTPATSIIFNEELKSVADIGTNTWLRYEGTRDKTGVVVASKITFVPVKPPKPKTARPDDLEDRDEEIRYTAISDSALQQRIQRLGMSVVPTYQKALPDSNPSKIHFRFVATENQKYRWEICSGDGLILLPKLVIDRLANDDQLAALLADGVAFHLQRQGARLDSEGRLLHGIETSGYLFLPVIGLPAVIGGRTAERKMLYAMEEQRGRVALALMNDAGYDPWQAPEAWRLLAPKHLPADRNSLHYPDNSGYLLNILAMQYPKESPAANAVAALP